MRILHEISYERPKTLPEALALLLEHGASARPLAGGTDLVVNMKMRGILQITEGAGSPSARWPAARRVPAIWTPRVVVSLAELSELAGVRALGDRLWVGPRTTMSELAAPAALPAALGALADAAAIMGSPLIRNLATVGGNVANARPAADTAVALLSCGARLEIASTSERREMDLAAFFTGPGKSVLRPNELIVGIQAPAGPHRGSAYERLGNRKQLEIALVGAAACIALDPSSGKIADARIALGAVGPTPVLASTAASRLVGEMPNGKTLAAAAAAARSEAKPIDDFRGSASYRLELVESLTLRALERALERAASKGGRA